MNVKELIRKDFGINLPIKGGFGDSMENAVIIEYEGGLNDFVATEYAYLKYIGIGRRIEWKILEQALISENDRRYDKIKIEVTQIIDEKFTSRVENYYFDITDCFGK